MAAKEEEEAPPVRRKIGLKGALSKKQQPKPKGKWDAELRELAEEYSSRCGRRREEEVFLLELYAQNDERLDAQTAKRYVASNTSAAAALEADVESLAKRQRAGSKRLVSVIAPTTARRRGFHESLYKCFADQTYEDKELIVFDTGSREPSSFFAKLRDPRVTYLNQEADVPTGAKRNECIRRARGECVAQFDDDDIYTPSYLDRMVGALGDAAMVKLCSWKWYDAPTNTLHWYDAEKDAREGFSRKHSAVGWHSRKWGYGFSYVLERAAVIRCGGFPETFLGEDYDLVMRLLARERCLAVADDPTDSIVLHLMHNNNSSVVAKHRTFAKKDLDGTFSSPLSETIDRMRSSGILDTELSTALQLARASRILEEHD